MADQPSHRSESAGPIRSAKDFVRRYFPNTEECPHCGGTGIKRGSDTAIRRPVCTCRTNTRGPCPIHGGPVFP